MTACEISAQSRLSLAAGVSLTDTAEQLLGYEGWLETQPLVMNPEQSPYRPGERSLGGRSTTERERDRRARWRHKIRAGEILRGGLARSA